MKFKLVNNFSQALSAELSEGATTLTLDGGADSFADASATENYPLTIFEVDGDGVPTGTLEVVYVSGYDSETGEITVSRAQEGTTAATWPAGTSVELRVTQGVLGTFLTQKALDSYAKSDTKAVAIGQNAATFDPEWSNSVAIGRDAAGNATSSVVLGYSANIDASTSTSAELKEYDFDGLVIIGSGAYADGAGDTTNGHNSYSVSVGYNAYSGAGNSIALGYYAEAKKNGSNAIGKEVVASADNATVMGQSATASGVRSVSLGNSSTATADDAIAVGSTASAQSAKDVAIGEGATANSQGTSDPALAVGSGTNAVGNHAVAVGVKDTQAVGDSCVALGYAHVEGQQSVGVGSLFGLHSSFAVAVGNRSLLGDYGTTPDLADFSAVFGFGCVAKAKRVTTLGAYSSSDAENAVALGVGAYASVKDGMRVTAIPYLPKVARGDALTENEETYFGATLDEDLYNHQSLAARSTSSLVVMQTEALDLTTANDVQSFDLPAGTMLFVDSIEVVVTGSDTPGGAPEVQVGTDVETPADLLAATSVGKTAVGGREKYAPLADDGVTSIRAEVTAAGTGTTYQARVIVKGYVMEL